MLPKQSRRLPLLLALLLRPAKAQTASFSVSACATGSPITAVPACDVFLQGKPFCPGIVDEASQKACICKQDMFNQIRE